MITRTLEAVYENGALKLTEPLDLAPSSQVRVRIEIPSTRESSAELSSQLDAAFADGPDEDEKLLQKHMARLRREQAEEW